jgi:hypothetical protein
MVTNLAYKNFIFSFILHENLGYLSINILYAYAKLEIIPVKLGVSIAFIMN